MIKVQNYTNYYNFIAAVFFLILLINFHLPELFFCIVLLYIPIKKTIFTHAIFGVMTLFFVYELYSHFIHVIPL